MKVVNIFGSPCSGKSTLASYLFSFLKQKNVNVELVREVAKDFIYERSKHILQNQLYITALQYKRLQDIKTSNENVEMIITDCPLILGSIYCQNDYKNELNLLIKKLHFSFNNINIFLNRKHCYQNDGRLHTEEESDLISNMIENALYDFYDDTSGVVIDCYKDSIDDNERFSNYFYETFYEKA